MDKAFPAFNVIHDDTPAVLLDVSGRVLAKCPQCKREYYLDEYTLEDINKQALADLEIQSANEQTTQSLEELLEGLRRTARALDGAISHIITIGEVSNEHRSG